MPTFRNLVATVLVAAIGVLGAGSALATTEPEDPHPSDPLDQEVSEDEATGVQQVVVDAGHLDIGPRFVDGEWTAQIRDDSVIPPVWRMPEDIVMRVVDAALLPVPDDPNYDFLQSEPGEELYVIPQNEIAGVVWLGWNTQDPEVVSRMSGGMDMTFLGAEGPGDVTMFLQSGNFDPPQLLWSTNDAAGAPNNVWVLSNTHVHSNWAFSEPGVYFLEIGLYAELEDGAEVSDEFILRFAVGDEVTEEEAFSGPVEGEVDQIDQTENTETGDEGESAPQEADSTLPIVVSVAVIVLVVVLATIIWLTIRARRARSAALAQVSSGSTGDEPSESEERDA